MTISMAKPLTVSMSLRQAEGRYALSVTRHWCHLLASAILQRQHELITLLWLIPDATIGWLTESE